MKELLFLLFQGVLVLFTIASTIMAVYSVQNKLRLRKVKLSWRTGRLGGYPLFATIFLLLMTALVTVVYINNDVERYTTFLCYLWIGSMWFISSYLASKHYINDYGIVKNINEPSQTIPWFQILDQVEREVSGGIEYTFSYSELEKPLVTGFKQLKIFVPNAKKQSFEKIVSLKLKNRFDSTGLPSLNLKNIQSD